VVIDIGKQVQLARRRRLSPRSQFFEDTTIQGRRHGAAQKEKERSSVTPTHESGGGF